MSTTRTSSVLRGIQDEQTRSLVRALVRSGVWQLSVTGGNHIKLTHDSGRSVVTGLTGGRTSSRKLLANVRRVERGEPTR